MQNAFYNNSIAMIHNNFAGLANSGDYAAAQTVLESGLEKFSNDRTLKKDLADLLKVRKQLLQSQ
jgi:isocitrate dehydrogenase